MSCSGWSGHFSDCPRKPPANDEMSLIWFGSGGSPVPLGEVDLRSKSGEGSRSILIAAPSPGAMPSPKHRFGVFKTVAAGDLRLSPPGRGAPTIRTAAIDVSQALFTARNNP